MSIDWEKPLALSDPSRGWGARIIVHGPKEFERRLVTWIPIPLHKDGDTYAIVTNEGSILAALHTPERLAFPFKIINGDSREKSPLTQNAVAPARSDGIDYDYIERAKRDVSS